MIKIIIAVLFVVFILSAMAIAHADVTSRLPLKTYTQHEQAKIPMEGTHEHEWDDLRLLLVTIWQSTDGTISWTHSGRREIRSGTWPLSKPLAREVDAGKVKIKIGQQYVVAYCSVCGHAIALYKWD